MVSGLGYLAYDSLNPPPTARYYATEQQCIADAIARRNRLTPEQCKVQFQYAMSEYNRITPVYQTQQQCQQDTNSVCTVTNNPSGWRPTSGGAYFLDEHHTSDRTYIYLGRTYSVQRVLPIYQSTSGLVTPSGARISVPQSGVLLQSRDLSSSHTLPARPSGYAAQGTVRGRGSFGSAVRLTSPRGFGGK